MLLAPLSTSVPGSLVRHQRAFKLLGTVVRGVKPVANMQLASCIFRGNDLISIGVNQNKTHPFQARYAKNVEAIYLHAEIDAIVKALKVISPEELQRCSMYVLRFKRGDETTGLAKPCSGCTRAIAAFGIKQVYYTLDSNKFGFL